MLFGLVEFILPRSWLIDIAANFEVQIRLRYRPRSSFSLSIRMLLPLLDDRICSRLPGLKATGSVANDFEVSSEGWANVGRSIVLINLESG
jgi:hypothetical protein